MNQQKNKSFFYGWVIAFCCALSVCSSSLLSSGMSTNLAVMRRALGLSGTQTSMILSIRSISAFVVALFAEKFFDHFGVRKGMMMAMVAGTVSFLIFAVAKTNMLLYYTAGAIAGIAYSYGMMMPSSILIKNWFNRSRGSALAIASCGTALVSIVFAPLIQSMVDNYGLNSALYMQGGFMFATAVILGILVVEKPGEKGLEPYGGHDFDTHLNKEKSVKAERGETSLSKGWVVALILATTMVGFTGSPASAHYTLNFTTEGLNPMAVAKGLSFYGIVLIAAKMCFGKSIDRLKTRVTTIIFGSVCAFAMFALFAARFFPNVTWLYISLTITGFGVVIQTLGYPNWVAELDSKNYDHTLERCQMGYQMGTLIGSPLPGMIADATGSYTWAYLIFGVMTVGYVLIVLAAFASQKRRMASEIHE